MTHPTEREKQIIALVLKGYSNPEIAAELGIVTSTVKARLRSVFLRLGIYDGAKRVKLAAMIYREELRCETSKAQTI
jgi:DNA-binding NarL/FixJ family response regulator